MTELLNNAEKFSFRTEVGLLPWSQNIAYGCNSKNLVGITDKWRCTYYTLHWMYHVYQLTDQQTVCNLCYWTWLYGRVFTEEVGQHGQSANTESTERCRRRNVAIQFMNHRLFTMSSHNHLLLLQLLSNLPPVTADCTAGQPKHC